MIINSKLSYFLFSTSLEAQSWVNISPSQTSNLSKYFSVIVYIIRVIFQGKITSFSCHYSFGSIILRVFHFHPFRGTYVLVSLNTVMPENYNTLKCWNRVSQKNSRGKGGKKRASVFQHCEQYTDHQKACLWADKD